MEPGAGPCEPPGDSSDRPGSRALTVSVRNRLLAALSPEDLERLAPHLEPVPFKRGQVLHSANRPLGSVHFVEAGLVSVLTEPERGHIMEVWLVGCEGLTGIPALLGGERSYHRHVALTRGEALRIDASELRKAMLERPSLAAPLLRFVEVMLVQTARVGACNARHSLGERLARWLLMARDRAVSDDLPLTHDMLSQLLGVRRAGVTEGINRLEREGFVRNERGRIIILDLDGLKAASCGCYDAVYAAYERILGGPKAE